MIRDTIDKTKRFVKRHPTLVACAITAAVTHKITYTRTYNGVLLAAVDASYEMGKDAGTRVAYFDTAMDFINDNGLLEQFKQTTGMDVVKRIA